MVGLVAQAQSNLVPNGGFEEGSSSRPDNWYFPNGFAYQRSSDAHSGSYAAKIYANAGTFYLRQEGETNVIDVEANAQYVLSYWYKGDVPAQNMELYVSWFDGNNRIKREALGKVSFTSQWQKREVTLTVPVGINKMGIAFYVSQSSGFISIDDISLVYQGNGGGGGVSVPTGVSVRGYQREIEVRWDKEVDKRLQWEVFVNNQSVGKSQTNQYLITGLEPQKSYKIKVRALKGVEFSDFSKEINAITSNMIRSQNDMERVPHLRTLNIDGECPQTIDLYYNDLANKNAKIQYFINSKQVFPTNNQLTFPKKGKQTLKIIIEETPNMKWELDYYLDVK
ncbi:hypothetical protein RCZ15_14670 [Capnocytophaga catalasegens]|uniref:Fibronectin type-III domain-containing protein n=2 Tax=Capnocytophaga catalasegens TaxID=1004260 RepID=A0AAV5AV56_9FLAO|nr:hypothetical protein RCZ03_13270 [Capnocytophaga catalasegens]GJM50494.1 hypothetical protein RCZ15_14670 [Capnocytophaga catalasegens]GJM52098.1 hypothetical protein RCZ16_04160 [Capnocytophaga catalasegens]